MLRSEKISELTKALAQFTADVKNPINDADNPYFKSRYSTLPNVLNLVRPILSKYGLSLIQSASGDGEKASVTSLLMHSSGEWIETDPLIMKPEKNTPQGIASAITYARRYQVAAMLNISADEDDDGAVASGTENAKSKKGKDATPPEPKESPIQMSELQTIKAEIHTLVNDKLISITDDAKQKELKKQMSDIIKTIRTNAKDGKPSANYQNIEDVSIAKSVLNAIKEMKICF
jgi:hypothetical protein